MSALYKAEGKDYFPAHMTPGNPPRAGLWLTAFFLLLVGGMVTGVIYLYSEYDMNWWSHFCLSLFITCLAVGITVICASAHWWLNR